MAKRTTTTADATPVDPAAAVPIAQALASILKRLDRLEHQQRTASKPNTRPPKNPKFGNPS